MVNELVKRLEAEKKATRVVVDSHKLSESQDFVRGRLSAFNKAILISRAIERTKMEKEKWLVRVARKITE